MDHSEFSDQPNFYSGLCNTCGEVYEAQSVVEDLEGVSFSCKKGLCKGSIELKTNFKENSGSIFSVADIGPISGGPKRFC